MQGWFLFPLVVSYAAPVPVIEHSAPALVVTNVQRERTKARSLSTAFPFFFLSERESVPFSEYIKLTVCDVFFGRFFFDQVIFYRFRFYFSECPFPNM